MMIVLGKQARATQKQILREDYSLAHERMRKKRDRGTTISCGCQEITPSTLTNCTEYYLGKHFGAEKAASTYLSPKLYTLSMAFLPVGLLRLLAWLAYQHLERERERDRGT